MDDSSKRQAIPDKAVKLMIDNIFRKNNVKTEEAKKNISDEQKQALKEMVEDLKQQVDQFNKGDDKSSE